MFPDRRQYRRLNAPLYWNVSGLRGRHRPVDVSLGGMRVYSDDALHVGGRIDLELFELSDGARRHLEAWLAQ